MNINIFKYYPDREAGEVVHTYLAPLAETLETELMHARVREAFTPAARQANGTIWWRR